MRRGQREREIKPLLRNIPVFLTQLINFLLQEGSRKGAMVATSWFYGAWHSRWSRRSSR
jgi:hypothetical protein